jgi:hypothetical protein
MAFAWGTWRGLVRAGAIDADHVIGTVGRFFLAMTRQ